MKKFIYILILFTTIGLFSSMIKVNAADPLGSCATSGGTPINNITQSDCKLANPNAVWTATTPQKDSLYHFLAPLPCDGANCTNGQLKDFDPTQKDVLTSYLNTMIRIIIGLAAVLAVVMIVIGGIQYMTSELISSKEAGRSRITQAILGLLLALGSYALLNTINPEILKSEVNIPDATVQVDLGGENTTVPFKAIAKTDLQQLGVSCGGTGGKAAVGTIGQQFIGKTTYSQTARNTFSSSTIYLDCSSFVDQVYACAGLASPGNNTNQIFGSGAQPVDGPSLDETKLHPGDLLGWKPSDDKFGNGHVVIYMGNGKILDASSTAGGVQLRDLKLIKDRIRYAKWSN